MAEKKLEVVVLGCGVPKFSMGWTHLFQLLQEPLASMASVAGVVEPFFLSEQGKATKGADLFREWMAQHPEIPCVDSISKLPAVAPGKLRVALISVRTPDAKQTFVDAVVQAGCRGVYLEKPGATSVAEVDEMARLAEERGVTVFVGYSRNLGYPKRGLAFAQEQRKAAGGREPRITLLHANPFKEEEMAACFDRCRPGMLYDMACHDLAMAVAFFGLTTEYTGLTVDAEKSLQATYAGIEDFVRLAFAVTPKDAANPINFCIDRCAGAFNGMEVEVLAPAGGEPSAKTPRAARRFMCGEAPLFENPLEDLAPHLAVQYDYYVEGKRVLLEALQKLAETGAKGQAELPPGAATLRVAREVMLLADRLTAELKAKVPRAAAA